MRILITGSEGTLGQVLKKELRSRGHDVYGCDLMHTVDPQVLRADIAELRQLDKAFTFSRPDVVFHLAAEFGRTNGQEFFEQMWRTNVIGTQNVIRLCASFGPVLVFASSSEAYGCADLYAPKLESYFKEEWLDRYAPEFHNQYALSKWTNERQIFMAAKNDGLKAVVLRIFNVYGPGECYTPYRSVVCLFIYRLLKDLPITVYRNSFRSHLYVRDWAEWVAQITEPAILESIQSKITPWPGSGSSGVPVFNLGGSEYESSGALLDRIMGVLLGESKLKVTFKQDEKANIVSKMSDTAQARRWLEYAPETKLEEGLALTIKWMRETYAS